MKMVQLATPVGDGRRDRWRVQITPPHRYAKGYLDWLGEKRDWPVSQQLSEDIRFRFGLGRLTTPGLRTHSRRSSGRSGNRSAGR
ncbi:MAG: hypothetical protein R3C99_06385 [Pirellulaceae bacterium]